jgi:hypothetical protein
MQVGEARPGHMGVQRRQGGSGRQRGEIPPVPRPPGTASGGVVVRPSCAPWTVPYRSVLPWKMCREGGARCCARPCVRCRCRVAAHRAEGRALVVAGWSAEHTPMFEKSASVRTGDDGETVKIGTPEMWSFR